MELNTMSSIERLHKGGKHIPLYVARLWRKSKVGCTDM